MAKGKAFLCFCLAFIAGVFFDSLFGLETGLVLGILFVIAFLFLKREKETIAIVFCFLFLLFGISRHQAAIIKAENNPLREYNNLGQEVIFEGRVAREPVEINDRLRLTVAVENPKNNSFREQGELGKVLVTTTRYPEYQYGERLRIKGELKEPPVFEEFNYKNYLLKEGIVSVVYWPEIERTGGKQGKSFLGFLLAVKKRMVESLNRFLSPPQSALLEALLFGKEENLSSAWKEKLNLTGTRHLAAVSGMNITIISALVFNFFLLLGCWRQQAFYFSLILICAYVLLVGGQASAIRAGIMGILFLFGQHLGRLAVSLRLLVMAAVLMLWQNPLLTWDVGFQLSCLAVLGLIYFQPMFSRFFVKLPKFLMIRETLSATLAAQTFTLPLLLYNFGRIPLLSLFANVLIIPLLAPITVMGFCLCLLNAFLPFIGQVFSWLVWLFSSYILLVIDLFSRIKFNSLVITNVHWFWLVVFYCPLTGFILFREKKLKQPFFLQ
ncbi:MAG: hypothetical protein COT34_01010 [Candidatus Nealsonbacteria bacterium CG08_land_8_20_14_0_20_43_11]|uniref:ComEC/Rec2-related protein domain-containing protein n=1 Tax=Candidatus Nealsonbacteria bacterium CG08_land_8_20_14_0_20_43_11 TaxID=1974706 RepID=A0A2M6T0U7_9BACT|nr:MAG: hypothetical protein COT34_01010 [Candidatus Nealsonbacteria bacterium CG08_land_8_20_14_0_20_43_11]